VARQLAVMYQDKRDTTQLLHMLHHILQVDINDNELRKSTAQILVMRGHGDSAVMLLDEALARNPNLFELLIVKAIALGAQSKFDSAGAVMTQASEIDSTKVDSGFISRTLEFSDRARDSVRSLEWMRRGTVKAPTWIALRYRYASTLLGKGDTAGAVAGFRDYMNKAPGDGRGHLALASIFAGQALDDSAMAHAKMAGDADSTLRPVAAGIFLRVAVKALQASSFPRADSLFGQAQDWAQGDAQKTAQFYRGVAQFQEGYAFVQIAQDRYKAKDSAGGCPAVKSATDFLILAETNITAAVAANREMASQLLGYLPQLRTALTQLGGPRALKCPS
jgi:Flp pilus assembly protein TadD